MYEYIIVGGGPIAYSVGLYLFLHMTKNFKIIDPTPNENWPCTICNWKDDVDSSWFGEFFNKNKIKYYKYIWNTISIKITDDEQDKFDLDKSYIMYDNDKIKYTIMNTINVDTVVSGYGVEIKKKSSDKNCIYYIDTTNKNINDVVVNGIIDHDKYDLKELMGKNIIDCTGHYTKLTQHDSYPARNWQTFLGEIITGPHNFDLDKAFMFDWSMNVKKPNMIPTFAYVLPYDENTVFVEETVLVDHSNEWQHYISSRIRDRKKKLGLYDDKYKISWSERVAFPMGGSKSIVNNGVIAIGASNRDVHPSTGFMIQHVINNIPKTISTTEGVTETGIFSDTMSERIKYNIFLIGAEMIIALKTIDNYRLFFRTFFKLPEKHWFTFMTRRGSLMDLIKAMLVFFIYAPIKIKIHILINVFLNLRLLIT